MAAPAPILSTAQLSKRFGGLLATDCVDLAVGPGEIRGIIGPNGAGKTTLVNLITGVYPPSAGDIRLAGESLVGRKPHDIARRGLIRTFQVSRLFGNLSVFDNLMVPHLALAPRDRDAGAERANELLALTRLDRLAHDPAKSLSGGQRVLLQVMAGFMSPNLKCYLLDEPFAGVNPVIKDAIIELIEHENRTRAITFVVVSHEMAIVRRLCRRITVLIEGRIAAEGTLDQVCGNEAVITAYLGKGFVA